MALIFHPDFEDESFDDRDLWVDDDYEDARAWEEDDYGYLSEDGESW